MFGHRSDGKELKNLSPIFKIMPSVMKERCDAQVYFNQDINITPMENYIAKKAEEGIKLSILDIVFAAVVRIIAERPQLNRFCVNGRTYARNDITISLAIKKSLTDGGEETNIKPYFTGNETIFEVRQILQDLIEENKKVETQNSMDKFVNFINKIPTSVIKFIVSRLVAMDKRGHLPKSIIKLSPFHTSAYITNVGSLGINSIYHHIYNFGTTSLFFAMGKKKKSFIYEDDEIREEKAINVAFVGDERICDGYYFASSFRQLYKYLMHPELLETPGKREQEI